MHKLSLPWIFGVPAGGQDEDISAAGDLCRQVQENSQSVIGAAIAVEKELEKVISARVAGEPNKVNAFFADHILSADWFTFANKRKLVLDIFDEYQHLKGQDRADLENVLRKVMSLRNRFAHGHLSVVEGIAYINYFENKLHQDPLTDDFWKNVEEKVDLAIRLLAKGQKSMGITPGWGLAV